MPGVHWSRRARARLEIIDPAVRDQLTSNAGKFLHDMPPASYRQDEGREGEIMWHRGITCGAVPPRLLAKEDDDGPWNYFLIYTQWRPDPDPDADPQSDPDPDPVKYFEVLDIIHVTELADRWEMMEGGAS
jgi:hypothetical protein